MTLWSWAPLERSPVVRTLYSFPAFYGTRRFNTEFTRALHLSILSHTNPVHITPSYLFKIHIAIWPMKHKIWHVSCIHSPTIPYAIKNLTEITKLPRNFNHKKCHSLSRTSSKSIIKEFHLAMTDLVFLFTLGARTENFPNSSNRTLALQFTQLSAQMSTRRSYTRSVRKADDLSTICELIVEIVWDPRHLTTVLASTACKRDSFTFVLYFAWPILNVVSLESFPSLVLRTSWSTKSFPLPFSLSHWHNFDNIT
jgi:hypothetical protein